METIQKSVFFGSFECVIPHTFVPQKATTPDVVQVEHKPKADPFTALEERLQSYFERRKHARVIVTKSGITRYKHISTNKFEHLQRKESEHAQELRAFFAGSPTVITQLNIAGGVSPSRMENSPKGVIHTTKSAKIKQPPKQPVKVNKTQFNQLLAEIREILRNSALELEVIGKHSARGAFRERGRHKVLTLITRHSEQRLRKVDLPLNQWQDTILLALCKSSFYGTIQKGVCIQKGDSGTCVPVRFLPDDVCETGTKVFVVRGSDNGKLVDVRRVLSHNRMFNMEHYSMAENFWRGFNKTWVKLREEREHKCNQEIPVEQCGKASSILVQSLIPCFKMTCSTCVSESNSRTKSELVSFLHSRVGSSLAIINDEIPEYSNVEAVLKLLQQFLEQVDVEPQIFAKIFQTIGDRTNNPFKQLNELNNFFAKGCLNSTSDWTKAYNSLLELVLFQKNRTDNIKKGDIASFRNKLSAKANYNFYLSCDNQLDKNANFLWGEREYHARRFFRNFFVEVDHEKGYAAYEERKGPASSRKIAINNLIVPLDFAEFRNKMKGELEKQPATGKACVSTRDGNFIYTCCCTTYDDGSAIESPLYAPTKKHLVIGNTGDSKYIDLPKGDTDTLFIVREGYCYINLFLAMLVNISETEAKDFTKQVRDIHIPKLGKWPTLLDVATTCAQLRIFYPDIHDAELPRILVDHNNQMCHVVDSFGSITTGYHILKASTLSQLVLFASDELQSDIKMYRVGGKLSHTVPPNADDLLTEREREKLDSNRLDEMRAIKLLIKGIFRPKLMQQILTDEPYLIFLSVLSPGILMALFNNGAFEVAIKTWLTRKQSIAMAASMMAGLASKVSVAETLIKQKQIIESHASGVLATMCDGLHVSQAYMLAQTVLERLCDKAISDEQLTIHGYLSYENDTARLLEKSYLELLEEEWKGLSWRGKLAAIWFARKQKSSIVKTLTPVKSADLKGMYDISPGAYLERVKSRFYKWVGDSRQKVSDFLSKKVFNLTAFLVKRMFRKLPKLITMMNSIFILSGLISIASSLSLMVAEKRESAIRIKHLEDSQKEERVLHLYTMYTMQNPEAEWKDFLQHVSVVDKELWQYLMTELEDNHVVHQRHTSEVKGLEQVVAFITLIFMTFDSERSDCVFRTLNKLKSVVGSLDNDVRHQSLDDIIDIFDDKKHTIDFTLDDDVFNPEVSTDTSFDSWWIEQMNSGNVIPHYRTEGEFMEFTRATSAKVASDISQSSVMDFLIRGAVGSGKSTGLPSHLSTFGKVLLVEPTRPLAENVHKQLSGPPFFKKPTLRMRGHSVFGSSPISVMTSGFALHFFAHNVQQLLEFKYVILDECHVLDASAMAFRSLLQAYHSGCKVIKVSATPPGREVEFTTQHPVKLIVEEQLSFKNFVEAQGTGSNVDVVAHGNNILVYVASYNEVDQLSKLLTDKSMLVTKVDGRTMKHGVLEIVTKGTQAKPHFVVATNIIENGVTLDIDVVVDFGMKVSPFLDVDNRSVAYTKVSINYGERIQRLGRVGRIQKGVALRIGHTEKGLTEIPQMIANEAALHCFAYNLPVMASGVSTSLVSKCTIRQVRTMQQFELSPYFIYNFVAHDGTMHPVVHDLLKQYKLNDAVTPLSEQSIPFRASSKWLTARDYEQIGVHVNIQPQCKIAFHIRDIPAHLHQSLWDAVVKYKASSIFPTIKTASISKIAYTLSTDLNAIPRTLNLIEKLIEDERTKQNQFRSLLDNGSSSMFSIVGITNALRARYSTDYTSENIRKLEMAKAQLKEFNNVRGSGQGENLIAQFEALQYVQHQSYNELVNGMCLKGIWAKKLLVRDVLVASAVAVGGIWILYSWFTQSMGSVHHQGKAKSKRIQALKMRKARDKRAGFEIDNNEDTIEEYFGSAYTKKGKGKGTKIGMGKTNRRFYNMYGFKPDEYSYIKFVDPLTGAQIEESIYADIFKVQEKFGDIRNEMVVNDEIDSEKVRTNTTIQAYFVKDWSDTALRVDLTPHNPLRVGENTASIAKFPERAYELRQTGKPIEVLKSEIPEDEVEHESSSLMRGLRDYNPISHAICQVTSQTEFGSSSMFALGYGPLLIVNHHLFKSYNGTLEIRSHHGVFRIPNMTQLQVRPVQGRDIIVVRLPKDMPVFAQRLRFRSPKNSERVCIVGSNFQEKSISSTITETSSTHHVANSTFWKHWIATDDGHCGLPIVSTTDGCILGIHSLANNKKSENYYTAFDDAFKDNFLDSPDTRQWAKNWKYNAANVAWGHLKLVSDSPKGMFKTTKIIEDLTRHEEEVVREQSAHTSWMLNALKDNLIAVSYMKNQLITKHVVKGECIHFKRYLEEDQIANEFFKPLMWAYGKSNLNKEAYIKDLLKYAEPIQVGVVNCDAFEEAVCRVILYLNMKGFRKCSFVTDEEDIFRSLNMKAAVGAMYGGKKKDYFSEYTQADKEQILRESCLRLYSGKMGVWNGSLKAELRCKEKIEANKTRTFTAAPLDTLLAGKVCVDDFNNQFYSRHTDCCWSVGMTKFYGGWDRLLQGLPDGWVFCDADGSRFDSSLTPYLINAVLTIRLTYMEEWDIGFEMLKNLYTEIVYTPIATPDGTIVKKFRGNNSGQPSTVVDNSLMVIIAMHYAFTMRGFALDEVENHCKFYVNGDDLIIAVHPDHETFLDSLQAYFSELGLNYEFSSRTRNKEDLWFMSHKAIMVNGIYIPKLEEERIVSILQWDRAELPECRLEAICAAMIESWGYPELTHMIRRFYHWLINQEPFKQLAEEGKAPYIAEMALKKLYLNENVEESEIEEFLRVFAELDDEFECGDVEVYHQSLTPTVPPVLDAGVNPPPKPGNSGDREKEVVQKAKTAKDKEVDAGTSGTHTVPRIKAITPKMRMPKTSSGIALNLEHLLGYKPDQLDISNARATQGQFDTWFEAVRNAYDITPEEMTIVCNGLMVWCVENGTSPNINGVWTMMEGNEQIEYPLKPIVENAKPTLRQIMAHFSDVAEAYIEMRNMKEPYMPRYGLIRNLRDTSLARYAFDFYEINSRTPARAKEAVMQMKAAALKSSQSRMFGLDGGISTQEENTERHTTEDVSPTMHSLLGVRNM
ncbi:polyprotein [Barbacena virus Y]|uniref:Genome polyprotein n=1 Tax=Barbacena virus Y TaxID=2170132 RepID=A0A1B2RUY7_9POTV|nr:polyprotein [Barbacena virus Y]AOC37868.1 polyprotein [Barbacena virus Y]